MGATAYLSRNGPDGTDESDFNRFASNNHQVDGKSNQRRNDHTDRGVTHSFLGVQKFE